MGWGWHTDQVILNGLGQQPIKLLGQISSSDLSVETELHTTFCKRLTISTGAQSEFDYHGLPAYYGPPCEQISPGILSERTSILNAVRAMATSSMSIAPTNGLMPGKPLALEHEQQHSTMVDAMVITGAESEADSYLTSHKSRDLRTGALSQSYLFSFPHSPTIFQP